MERPHSVSTPTVDSVPRATEDKVVDAQRDTPCYPTPSCDERHSCPKRLSVPLSKSSTTTTLADSPLEVQERVNVRLASAFVIFFVLGWGDGVTGTLLPYFKADFHLSFMTSSLCFVASTAGFALGTTLVERILGVVGWVCLSPNSRISFLPALLRRCPEGSTRGYSATQARFVVTWAGTLLHPVFFVIMGCRRNFASMLVAYAISAFARSLLTANMNHYVASTPKRALGYMYGFWSIGSMCAPLVCQSVIATGIAWNHFYFGSLVLSGISSTFAFFAFRPRPAEIERDVTQQRERTGASEAEGSVEGEKERKLPQTPDSEATIGLPELVKESSAPSKTLLRALKTPLLWALVLFLGIYTGTEAGTQGFIVTYLLGVRNANPRTVGYSTSGFWGGQAISRFVWGYINLRMTFTQRKYTVQICIALALALQLTVWFVNSFIENCFAAALLGLVYGPMYVAGLALVKELLPANLHMISMQIGASFGSFGAALFPFLIGTVMNYKGPKTLVYMLVSQTATIMVLWFLLPSKPRYT